MGPQKRTHHSHDVDVRGAHRVNDAAGDALLVKCDVGCVALGVQCSSVRRGVIDACCVTCDL